MFRKLGFASFSVALLTYLLGFHFVFGAQAQALNQAAPLITQGIDESRLVTLRGNTRSEANPQNDRGPVANNLAIEHMLLQLRRSPEQEQALKQFIDELHDRNSPNFHQWLTAEQFGARFGLAQQDLDTISRWLESHGFKVNLVYPSGILIDFSGTAGDVREAFHTEIHQLDVNGVKHIANVRDPQIPAALAPAVAGIVSLHDFRPRPMVKLHHDYTFSDPLSGTVYAVVPGDLATIYNFNPLFSSGVSGQGQTIVVVEDTDVFSTSDWSTFRSTFGLSKYTSGSFTQVHPAPPSGPNNCSDPGVIGTATNPVDAEAILDAEYASAAAPSAAIQLISCSDTSTTFGGLIAIQNLINASATLPAIVSVSYGECEAVNGPTANAAYNSTYQQAVAEGVSVYVAAGDSGAAGCDPNQSAATSGIAVSAFASTPYNVAVGGTDFSDTYASTNSTYWNSGNTSNYASALSYVPEIPWNDSCTGLLLATYYGVILQGVPYPVYGPNSFCNADGGLFASALGVLTTGAGSGGPSGCAIGTPSITGVVSGSCAGYPKPSWQQVFGNPNDGVRDIPDVSLFAAAGVWSHYYLFCFSDTASGGTACSGAPSGWTGAGGTSFAAPIMAGVQALINQKTGSRQGNPNPTFYNLAATEYGSGGSPSCNSSLGYATASSCIFYDVTLGDMAVDCTPLVLNNKTIGTFNCFDSSAGYGALSTSNNAYQTGYGTSSGWDFATGIGSVNVANLVSNWPNFNPAALSIMKTHTGNFTQGQQNATYSVTVSNGANAGSTNGTVTVSETLPSGLTLVSMAGTGWACGAGSCTRSDVLSAAGSYPAITVTVNVASSASSPQVNQVNVSGGGSASAGATDSTTITIGVGGGGAVANFISSDANTEGSWHGVYGADGYSVANDSQSIPSYASFAVQNQLNYTWAASTTDPRALQTGSDTGRIAATWYNTSSFDFDVNFTDGKSHQFALYALDWDSAGRSETVQILDANTEVVLDTRTISGFTNGTYLIWNISGHVKINITLTGGANAVVSGAFFK
ncbi:MAG TPA: protease pro-enzyme activation domain-containing protein [Candidatus Acidoferrales bacterium]|nr:protease pro-enzyme activation domain-containing protein [Candidatus Acidoferrales bacterium]